MLRNNLALVYTSQHYIIYSYAIFNLAFFNLGMLSIDEKSFFTLSQICHLTCEYSEVGKMKVISCRFLGIMMQFSSSSEYRHMSHM